jgi:hypothetical protein
VQQRFATGQQNPVGIKPIELSREDSGAINRKKSLSVTPIIAHHAARITAVGYIHNGKRQSMYSITKKIETNSRGD